MDLDSSPNKSLEDAKDDGFGFGLVGKRSSELDLNLAASKDEEGDEEYVHDENDLGDHEHRGMCTMDLNLQEHRKPPESCVEIGVGFRARSSKSPPLNPRSASPVPIDDKFCHAEIGSDHYLGKSRTPITVSRISDYCLGSSDYNSDRLQSPEDSKSHEGDDTRKMNSDQQPMSAVNPDDYPKETERENTDPCEQKSTLQVTHEHFNDETGPENPYQLSEKLAFEPMIESAEDEMEITHDHHLRGLLSPAVTVDSDDEAKNEHFYSGKSGSPVSREPYNYNGEVEGENSYLQSPGRTPKRLASPVRRQMSVSPERSPYESRSSGQKPPSPVKDFQEPGSYETQALQPLVSDTSRSPRTKNRSPSPGLSRQKLSPSPKRDLPKDYVLPHASPYSKRQLSPSFRRSSRSPAVRRSSRSPAVRRSSRSPAVRRSSRSSERAPAHDTRQRDDSPRNHLSPSPRRRYSPPRGHGRQGRSASRSPVRRRDAYSGSRRDYRERSRSRSPYSRDQFRRSPRRRYSPRRRSPPPRYHSRYRSPRRRPWSPPPNRSTGVGKPGNNLFIAGFSFVTTERDLERKFSRFGRVTDVRVVRDKRSGDSRGFGFLSLERDEDADAAIRALDQTEWNGRVVLVEKSKTPAR